MSGFSAQAIDPSAASNPYLAAFSLVQNITGNFNNGFKGCSNSEPYDDVFRTNHEVNLIISDLTNKGLLSQEDRHRISCNHNDDFRCGPPCKVIAQVSAMVSVYNSIAQEKSLPFYIKLSQEGSYIGVSKVANQQLYQKQAQENQKQENQKEAGFNPIFLFVLLGIAGSMLIKK